NNGDTHEVSTTATFNDGFWHHYALTMAPGGISKVYVDGVLNASNTDAYAVGSTTNFTRLGCNDNIAQFLDGNMDNLKVWNRVLGAGEVASIYNQPVIHINTAAITDCANAPVGVDFSLLGGSGSFQSGNEFYIQISNAAGSFRYPKLIGSLTGNSSGTINFNIPPDLASGTYKLRIIATEFPAISENT